MCLITYAPNGRKTLDLEALAISRRQNSDGYGLAWFKEEIGRWSVAKSMRPFTLERVLNRLPEKAPVIIHQRFATHGSKDLDNAHPFGIKGGVLLFHNGVISGTSADFKYKTNEIGNDGKAVYRSSHRSDTRAYVEDELAPIIQAAGTNWLHHPRGVDALEARVGYGNVLTICVPNNPIPIIVNEKRGDWRGPIYYSNTYSITDYRPYGTWRDASSSWDEWDDFVRERDAAATSSDTTEDDASGDDKPLPVDKVIYLSGETQQDEPPACSPLGYETKPEWMDEDEWERWKGLGITRGSKIGY